ncbi:YNFM family putative membrane transporter [Anoxybacillus vitaminiphilus]|uniref:YNFM family putative membrane transporter n=1 Tax=Paranoxybacillus vitaminiphilus TaxID=581036 RepID=A0A327Y1R6_9BACL|nr:MFS transporter [Anoxybacillus vitaminiphilus]RAK14262.1 YNFM family putative membrane transporter [Anoxybacillus vitaminiphilus]
MTFIQKGTKEYRRASFSLFLGGFLTFAILYTTQPLMPIFAEEFHVSAAAASLSLSVSTGVLAIVMLVAAAVSDMIGKKQIMVISMFFTAVLSLVTALSPNFVTLVIVRFLLGFFIAGVPSIAMAYVAEEFNPNGIGKVMGLYISGTTIGGMAGRIITSVLTDLFNWRIALTAIGMLALVLSIVFWLTLPAPRNSVKKPLDWSSAWRAYKVHIVNKSLMSLVILSFLLMGSFVTLYNYIGFLLAEPPYELSQTLIGFIFIVYICGTFSSIYMGNKADQYGYSFILKISIGIMVSGAFFTLVPSLIGKIVGIAIFTFGFFASHSIASAWVGDCAGNYKVQASSLYLLFYYLGSSIVGSFGGYFWSHFHWIGVISLISGLLIFGYILVLLAQKSGVAIGSKN